MKRKWLCSFVAMGMATVMLAGCGGNGEASKKEGSKSASDDKVKVALLVTGSFGDKAFNDSAQAGMKNLPEVLGDKVEYELIEM